MGVRHDRVRQLFLILILISLAAASAAAFTLTPMTVTISPSGAQSIITFKVTNDSTQQIAVALKMATRVIDETGKETNQPADKDFLVFPSRVVLLPEASQNIKVQYKGQAAITSEAAYRFIAEQLPIDFTKATSSGVNIMLRYVAALYVAPAKVKVNLVLASAIGAEKDGKRGLSIALKNEGSRHALLYNTLIRILHGSESSPVEISGGSMSEIEGQNILAFSTRKFFIPWESAVMGAVYEGAFSAEFE